MKENNSSVKHTTTTTTTAPAATSPIALSRLQARRQSMDTPTSRLQIRRTSFTERLPTPIPPFVAPDVDVPEQILRESMKKYHYLPTNTPENSPRPATPIPSEETLKTKSQVFHMLNQQMEDMHERERHETHQPSYHDLTPHERNSAVAEQVKASNDYVPHRRNSHKTGSTLHRYAMINSKEAPLTTKYY